MGSNNDMKFKGNFKRNYNSEICQAKFDNITDLDAFILQSSKTCNVTSKKHAQYQSFNIESVNDSSILTSDSGNSKSNAEHEKHSDHSKNHADLDSTDDCFIYCCACANASHKGFNYKLVSKFPLEWACVCSEEKCKASIKIIWPSFIEIGKHVCQLNSAGSTRENKAFKNWDPKIIIYKENCKLKQFKKKYILTRYTKVNIFNCPDSDICSYQEYNSSIAAITPNSISVPVIYSYTKDLKKMVSYLGHEYEADKPNVHRKLGQYKCSNKTTKCPALMRIFKDIAALRVNEHTCDQLSDTTCSANRECTEKYLDTVNCYLDNSLGPFMPVQGVSIVYEAENMTEYDPAVDLNDFTTLVYYWNSKQNNETYLSHMSYGYILKCNKPTYKIWKCQTDKFCSATLKVMVSDKRILQYGKHTCCEFVKVESLTDSIRGDYAKYKTSKIKNTPELCSGFDTGKAQKQVELENKKRSKRTAYIHSPQIINKIVTKNSACVDSVVQSRKPDTSDNIAREIVVYPTVDITKSNECNIDTQGLININIINHSSEDVAPEEQKNFKLILKSDRYLNYYLPQVLFKGYKHFKERDCLWRDETLSCPCINKHSLNCPGLVLMMQDKIVEYKEHTCKGLNSEKNLPELDANDDKTVLLYCNMSVSETEALYNGFRYRRYVRKDYYSIYKCIENETIGCNVEIKLFPHTKLLRQIRQHSHTCTRNFLLNKDKNSSEELPTFVFEDEHEPYVIYKGYLYHQIMTDTNWSCIEAQKSGCKGLLHMMHGLVTSVSKHTCEEYRNNDYDLFLFQDIRTKKKYAKYLGLLYTCYKASSESQEIYLWNCTTRKCQGVLTTRNNEVIEVSNHACKERNDTLEDLRNIANKIQTTHPNITCDEEMSSALGPENRVKEISLETDTKTESNYQPLKKLAEQINFNETYFISDTSAHNKKKDNEENTNKNIQKSLYTTYKNIDNLDENLTKIQESNRQNVGIQEAVRAKLLNCLSKKKQRKEMIDNNPCFKDSLVNKYKSIYNIADNNKIVESVNNQTNLKKPIKEISKKTAILVFQSNKPFLIYNGFLYGAHCDQTKPGSIKWTDVRWLCINFPMKGCTGELHLDQCEFLLSVSSRVLSVSSHTCFSSFNNDKNLLLFQSRATGESYALYQGGIYKKVWAVNRDQNVYRWNCLGSKTDICHGGLIMKNNEVIAISAHGCNFETNNGMEEKEEYDGKANVEIYLPKTIFDNNEMGSSQEVVPLEEENEYKDHFVPFKQEFKEENEITIEDNYIKGDFDLSSYNSVEEKYLINHCNDMEVTPKLEEKFNSHLEFVEIKQKNNIGEIYGSSTNSINFQDAIVKNHEYTELNYSDRVVKNSGTSEVEVREHQRNNSNIKILGHVAIHGNNRNDCTKITIIDNQSNNYTQVGMARDLNDNSEDKIVKKGREKDLLRVYIPPGINNDIGLEIVNILDFCSQHFPTEEHNYKSLFPVDRYLDFYPPQVQFRGYRHLRKLTPDLLDNTCTYTCINTYRNCSGFVQIQHDKILEFTEHSCKDLAKQTLHEVDINGKTIRLYNNRFTGQEEALYKGYIYKKTANKEYFTLWMCTRSKDERCRACIKLFPVTSLFREVGKHTCTLDTPYHSLTLSLTEDDSCEMSIEAKRRRVDEICDDDVVEIKPTQF